MNGEETGAAVAADAAERQSAGWIANKLGGCSRAHVVAISLILCHGLFSVQAMIILTPKIDASNYKYD
jgi:hypothetical protein